MLKQLSGSTKPLAAGILLLLVTACQSVNDSAICSGTEALRDELAAALLEDAGDRSLIAGDNLIAVLDAGCGG